MILNALVFVPEVSCHRTCGGGLRHRRRSIDQHAEGEMVGFMRGFQWLLQLGFRGPRKGLERLAGFRF